MLPEILLNVMGKVDGNVVTTIQHHNLTIQLHLAGITLANFPPSSNQNVLCLPIGYQKLERSLHIWKDQF